MKFFKFTKKGLRIASQYLQDVNDARIAAMSAAILSISERYLKEYAFGNLKRILIDTSDETIILSEKGEEGLLIMEARNEDLELKRLKEFMTSGRYKICKFCGVKFSKKQEICPMCGEKDV